MLKRPQLLGMISAIGVGVSACDGGGSPLAGSLQGPLSFTPNAVLATVLSLPDGGIDSSYTTILFADSDPAFACEVLRGKFPDSGTIQGLFTIELQQVGAPVLAGTYPVWPIGAGIPPPTLKTLVQLSLYGPASGVSPPVQGVAAGNSGTVTLTKVGSEYAGSFSATVVQPDGGESTLAGSFDTTKVCQIH
jgi:hypothetical protein